MSPRTRDRKRRQYGTGSVYQRKDGYWVGTLEAGWTAKGTRRRVTVYGRTEAEAKEKLKSKARDIAINGTPEAGSRVTVKTYADEWLQRIAIQVRPTSYIADRAAVRNWIIPTIGHKRFDALTPGDIRAVAKAQRDAGNKSSSALRTHSTLMKMLRDAVLDGHRVPQAAREVERPIPGASDRTAIPVAEALAILEQASRLPHGSRWVAGLLQGMRQAECLGLTWQLVDIDSAVPTFDVSWQLQPLPYAHGCAGGDDAPTCRKRRGASCPRRYFRVPDGFVARQLDGRFHLVRPKTEKGQRVIPLVPWMVTSLRAWREVAPASAHGLVWPAADGSPADAKDDLEEWHAIQCTAGVGHEAGRWYGTHEARHTTATLLLEAGVDPETIKAILGHSSIVTSRAYMHVNRELTQRAMQQVAAALQLEN